MPRLKIVAPEPPPDLVSRERLLRVLDQSADAAVTVLCAPAGSGKTLLLADWARHRATAPVAWVSLDSDDNVGYRFWSAVLDALCAHVPEDAALQRLAVPRRPSTQPGFPALVADALDELSRPLWLVLDDLHEVTSPEPMAELEGLLRHRPAMLHVVLSSRLDPRLPLGRLRLEDGLVELRARDLQFSAGETRRMLAGMGLRLSTAELARLLVQTEGWAAGVRLAALSLSGTPDRERFLTEFAGNNQAIGEFLIGEVLGRLPEPVRAFVQALSVCGEVCAELAAALSGHADAAGLLHELDQHAALAIRLGQHGSWYRVHALLRTYVLAQLRARDPGRAADLEGRAADWFAAHGEPVRALAHAAASGDEQRIVTLLRAHAVEALLAGEHGVLHRALAALPEGRVARESALGLVSACLHLETGEPRGAQLELSLAEAAWPNRPGGELRTLLRLTRARLALVTGDMDAMVRTTAELDPHENQARPLDTFVLLQRSAASLVAGEVTTAVEQVRSALRSARSGGHDYLAAQCLVMLGGLVAVEGDFRSMTTLAAQAVTENAERGWEHSIESATAESLLSFGALLRADLGASARHAGRAQVILDAGPAGTAQSARLFAGTLLGAVEFAEGARVAGARRMIAARLAAGETWLPPSQVALAAFLEHRAAVALGWTGTAAEVVGWCREVLPGIGELRLMRAQARLAQGRYPAAAALLRSLRGDSSSFVLPWSGIWLALAEAAIAGHAGERSRAHRALGTALTRAAPQNVLYPFVFAPPAVIELLTAGLGRFGAADEFARHVLKVRRAVHPRPDPVVLTVREREVLRMLPSQRSFDEIAEDLTVSPNTVKTHVRALYGKLSVTKRWAAVETAREQGLLEDANPRPK